MEVCFNCETRLYIRHFSLPKRSLRIRPRGVAFDRQTLGQRVQELASKGVYLGTSFWKHEGWRGQLYDDARYVYRGKFARTRFEWMGLAEYAEEFDAVCVDAAYYAFPRREYLEGLADQVPDDFRFGFKVTDEITTRKFPNLDRFGAEAGQSSRDFLNADRFATAFLKPCEYIRPKNGVLMFEFSRSYTTDHERGGARSRHEWHERTPRGQTPKLMSQTAGSSANFGEAE